MTRVHLAAALVLGVLVTNPGVADAGARRVALVDVPLIDASGRSLSFVGDVVGGSVVVVNPIWTGCSSFCPLTSAVLAELAERLGDRLDRDVRLVSLAIDPLEAPRAQLEGWVADYGDVPGWRWVGGAPDAVERLLAGLGEPFLASFDSHPASFLVVDGQDGRSVRFDGLGTDARALAEAIERLRPGP